LYLLEWETMQLKACFAQGIEANNLVVPLGMGIVGAAILQRKILNIVNARQHPFFNNRIDSATGYTTDSILASSIQDDDGNILGGVELLNSTTGRFTRQDENAFTVAVKRLALLMQRNALNPQQARHEMEVLHHSIGFDRSSIFVPDGATGHLIALYSEGLADTNIIDLNLKLGIAGLVAMTNQMMLIPDAVSDARFDSSFDKLTGYHTRNILCVPLRSAKGDALGVIQAINKLSGDFGEQDVEMLTGVAGIVSIAIENAMLLKDSERQFHSVLEALAASIDARDTLTAGHSQKVAQIALGIGKTMGFAEAELDVLHVSSILHDYGKIGVDDCVLKKNGKLDETEFTHMKQHATITCDILEKIHFARKYRSVPLIASSHHECLDGSGYPNGLDANEIPFLAKILAVSDIYEALTADRHYRKGMESEQALGIIQLNVDKNKLDGGIVAALRLYLAQIN
jgi:HD-GYP domain-containing protein (c-di-GMP phosphodiesterase class II)